MNANNLKLFNIIPRDLYICNNKPLLVDEELNIHLSLNHYIDANYYCATIVIIIEKASEKSTSNKSFYIKYAVDFYFDKQPEYIDLTSTREFAESVVKEVYPYIRANISAITAAYGISSINIPTTFTTPK